MVGSVGGWVLELFFRRIFSSKKWINPGFLNGPYLPMYGCGTLLLYGACFIPLPRWTLVLILIVALTLLEYITGLIFIKGLKSNCGIIRGSGGTSRASSARCFPCCGAASRRGSCTCCLTRCTPRRSGRGAACG